MDRFKRLLPNTSFSVNRRGSTNLGSKASNAETWTLPPPRPAFSAHPPKILIVGAGSRGNAFARAIMHSSNGLVAAVADPVEFRRKHLGRNYIWGVTEPEEGMEFTGWKDFFDWEVQRREKQSRGEKVPEGIDGVLVCTLDELHAEVVTGLAPLNLHILCEKPLATNLDDCLKIYASLLPKDSNASSPTSLFAVGHVMRYSPHNILLRKLLLEDEAIGEVISVEHTEPIGWWHFSHSYVRGNWRKTSTSAPSLLTKSCHDIDLLLWLLCSPADPRASPHLPSTVTSSGSLVHFKPSRKPGLAGKSTNCLSCPAEPDCQFSAKKIYVEKGLHHGRTGWPLNVAVPEVNDYFEVGMEHAEQKVLERLAEDYTAETDAKAIDSRGWYGRCVYESDNDVCDDQVVNITWEDDFLSEGDTEGDGRKGRGAKRATFHMVAHTADTSKRRTRVYGSKGELYADSMTITVNDFPSGNIIIHRPHLAGGGHGGGDDGLACQFALAMDAVKNHGMSVFEAQRKHIGCTLEDVIRSHAFVFAAEDARTSSRVVEWKTWWKEQVEEKLRHIVHDA